MAAFIGASGIAGMSKKSPKAKGAVVDVIARYGSFYRGDDDELAHCFIRADGQCTLLFQGLSAVTMSDFHAPREEFEQLVDLLHSGIPSGWAHAAYSGYDFVVEPPSGSRATDIAVYGIQAGAGYGQYYVAPPASDVGALVRAIAKID